VLGNVEWLCTDASYVSDGMLPSTQETRLRQEFELSDIVQAGAKVSDLSFYLGDMPGFFWIFVIVLVYQVVNVATAIVEVWIDALVFHYGTLTLLLLFLVTLLTWPVFIWYLVQTFSYSQGVMDLHQRTVQLCGMPADLCTSKVMEHFCNSREILFSSILLPPRLEEKKQANATCSFTVEVVFPSISDMQKALSNGSLTPQMRFDKHVVRVRPKVGSNAACVEWWLVAFEYLYETVPKRYWMRTTLSCLITMSLTKYATTAAIRAYLAVESAMGIVGLLLTKVVMMLSLISLFFFVGFHAFQEIVEANKERKSERRRDRVASEPLLKEEDAEAVLTAKTTAS